MPRDFRQHTTPTLLQSTSQHLKKETAIAQRAKTAAPTAAKATTPMLDLTEKALLPLIWVGAAEEALEELACVPEEATEVRVVDGAVVETERLGGLVAVPPAVGRVDGVPEAENEGGEAMLKAPEVAKTSLMLLTFTASRV